ncbi:MAG: hypothetical protein HQL80_07285 [Magnetococcales bacterium]|nr:hypothetical protein [Magnetococcales bacterium]
MNLHTPAWFGLTALLAFLSVSGWQNGWPLPVVTHLILAVGSFPLILAAMIYFTPVLTRSGTVPRWITRLPLSAMLAGGIATIALWQNMDWIGLAIPLAILGVAVGLGWTNRRAAKALGGAHPGLAWYQAALLCLLLGLLAILTAWLWPEQWTPLRMLHRHLNLLGFVGLTAIGTLQVLLPTVASYPDPQVGKRLRFDLRYALSGTLLMAAGAASWLWLSGLGLVAWGWVLGQFFWAIRAHYRQILATGGAALSLLLALVGFALTLLATLWQGGVLPLPLFIALFLFPLVTGALAHLLPLWWWPGLPTPQRTAAQQKLARYTLLRVGACWIGGLGMMAESPWAVYWLTGSISLFLGQLLGCLWPSNSPPTANH